MRNVQDCTEKLATLVELLSEMSSLEIRAAISHIDAKPGSDEARLFIHFTGRDIPLLTANNGRVLEAIEVLAADILCLTTAERNSLRVDAGSFLADQEIRMRRAARAAIHRVRLSGVPHVFAPMCCRDRRLLEMALVASGLRFETVGSDSARWVVLFSKEASLFLDTATAEPRHVH